MMKTKLALCLLLLVPLLLSAQDVDYKVFKIKGAVCKTVRKGRSVQKEVLKETDAIKEKDIISLTQGSELQMVSIKDSTMITLRDQCAGSVKSLVNNQNAKSVPMPKKYFDFVMKNLSGNGFNEGIAAGRTTAVYRGDEDMLSDESGDSLQLFPVLKMSCMPVAVPAKCYVKKESLKMRRSPKYMIIRR